MIAINKEEKELLSLVFPTLRFVRLKKRDSSRHHYYMPEEKVLTDSLKAIRTLSLNKICTLIRNINKRKKTHFRFGCHLILKSLKPRCHLDLEDMSKFYVLIPSDSVNYPAGIYMGDSYDNKAHDVKDTKLVKDDSLKSLTINYENLNYTGVAYEG